MENNTISVKELVDLILSVEDEQLASKMVRIFLQQQKVQWAEECYDRQAELASEFVRDNNIMAREVE